MFFCDGAIDSSSHSSSSPAIATLTDRHDTHCQGVTERGRRRLGRRTGSTRAADAADAAGMTDRVATASRQKHKQNTTTNKPAEEEEEEQQSEEVLEEEDESEDAATAATLSGEYMSSDDDRSSSSSRDSLTRAEHERRQRAAQQMEQDVARRKWKHKQEEERRNKEAEGNNDVDNTNNNNGSRTQEIDTNNKTMTNSEAAAILSTSPSASSLASSPSPSALQCVLLPFTLSPLRSTPLITHYSSNLSGGLASTPVPAPNDSLGRPLTCASQEVSFPDLTPHLKWITLRNSFASHLTIKQMITVTNKQDREGRSKQVWTTILHRFVLMQQPHAETEAQKQVTISVDQVSSSLTHTHDNINSDNERLKQKSIGRIDHILNVSHSLAHFLFLF